MARLIEVKHTRRVSYIEGPGYYTESWIDRFIELDNDEEKRNFLVLAGLHRNAQDQLLTDMSAKYNHEYSAEIDQYTISVVQYETEYGQYCAQPWYKRWFLIAKPTLPTRPQYNPPVSNGFHDFLLQLPNDIRMLYDPIPEGYYLEVISPLGAL